MLNVQGRQLKRNQQNSLRLRSLTLRIKKKDISTSTSTSTSATTQACPIIEEHGLPVRNNGYHIRKSQYEIREQIHFTERTRYRARKKAFK